MVGDDKRLASMAILIDDPATAGGYIIITWIARSIEHSICVDEQGDARLEMERRG
jgi:hypothetical protein